MAAHRGRQQRADAIGQREQRRLRIRDDSAAPAENERALRASERISESLIAADRDAGRPGAGGKSSGGRLVASVACCTSSGMLNTTV